MVVVSRYSTWRPIPLSHNFITSLFKLQRLNLRMKSKCLLQCMDIRNLYFPSFKRIYRRVHFRWALAQMSDKRKRRSSDHYGQWSIVVYWGYCQIRISILGLCWSSEAHFHLCGHPQRFWVHSLSYLAVSTCLLFQISFVNGQNFLTYYFYTANRSNAEF